MLAMSVDALTKDPSALRSASQKPTRELSCIASVEQLEFHFFSLPSVGLTKLPLERERSVRKWSETDERRMVRELARAERLSNFIAHAFEALDTGSVEDLC